MFVTNKCLLFVIYKANETSVDCIKLGREIKKAIKNYRNSIHQVHYKEYVHAQSRGLAEHFSWFW